MISSYIVAGTLISFIGFVVVMGIRETLSDRRHDQRNIESYQRYVEEQQRRKNSDYCEALEELDREFPGAS